MPNYKEMYVRLFNASEQAINILITAQRECEEMYMEEESFECSPTEAETAKED